MGFGLGGGDREVGIDIRANDAGATQTIRGVGTALGGIDSSAKGAHTRFGALGSTIAHVSTGIFLGVGMMGIQALTGAMSNFGGAIIGMNASLETSTLQFTTLMGDADRAKAHVLSLFDFAAKTPFETGPIIEASRMLQTFGGDALNTMKNIKLFGDAAAATSAPINEVSFWMGRAYAAIQAGRPFGEAAQRLSELGILTPQVRNKLEDLQKEGAKGPEIWGVLSKDLGRFGGSMEKLAGTWGGLTSTFSDGVQMILAGAFLPLFEGLKDLLEQVNAVLGSEGAQRAMKDFANGARSAFGIVGSIFGQVATVIRQMSGPLSSLGAMLGTLAVPIAAFVGALAAIAVAGPIVGAVLGLIGGVIAIITSPIILLTGLIVALASHFGLLGTGAKTAVDSVGATIAAAIPGIVATLGAMAQKFIAWIGPMIPPLLAQLAAFAGAMFGWLLAQLPLVAEQLMKWASAFIDWIAPMIPPFLAQLAKWALSMISWLLNTGVPKAIAALQKLAEKFLAWVAPMAAKLPGALMKFASALLGWIAGKLVPMVMPKIVAFGTNIITWLIGVLLSLPGKLWDFLVNVLIPAWTKWAPKIVASMFGIGVQMVTGIIKGLASLPGKVADKIASAFRNLRIDIGPFHISSSGVTIDLPKIDLPHFATGSWKLPADMVAMVHKGEMIVPADLAARLRGEAGVAGSSAVAQSAIVNGGASSVTIHQYFGPSSVRSREDIRDIGRETAERGRLLGALTRS